MNPAPRLGDDAARAATVAQKTARDKSALIGQLRKTPVIQIACEKTGVSRQTYYRWRDDEEFARAADAALVDGKSLVNDLAESQLLSAIRDGAAWGVQYWLKHHHLDYAAKMEVVAQIKSDGKLSPEQEATLEEALKLSHLIMDTRTESLEAPSGPSTSLPTQTHGTDLSAADSA
jgi:hypothetical protein